MALTGTIFIDGARANKVNHNVMSKMEVAQYYLPFLCEQYQTHSPAVIPKHTQCAIFSIYKYLFQNFSWFFIDNRQNSFTIEFPLVCVHLNMKGENSVLSHTFKTRGCNLHLIINVGSH